MAQNDPPKGTQVFCDGDKQSNYDNVHAKNGGFLNEPHPLLKGGQTPYPHTFSPQQVEVLTAMCDTIYPTSSLSPAPLEATTKIQAECLSSSAAWHVPEHIAGFLCKFLRPLQLSVISLFLYLLSTSLGTLALCGVNGLVKEFPFLKAFPKLPFDNRERSMRGWATSRFAVIQAIFKVLKGAAGYFYFAWADSNGHNPMWKEIGYHIPKRENLTEHPKRPLEGKVIDVKKEAALCDRLREFGFSANEVAMDRQGVDVSVKCDVVVVGSGSGGGVVAAVLAKAGFKVLVIEKGDYFAREDYSLIEASSGLAMIEGPNALLTKDGSIIVKAGSTVGGGSAINWSASLRTPEHVLSEWADVEKLGWFKDEKYQKALDAVCERIKAKVGFKKESLQNKVFREGCVRLGCHVEDVACNAVGEHFCGWCEFGCVSGAKQSTAETWLVDAVERGSLILSGCRVQRVLHRKGEKKERQATGVVADIQNGKLHVHAQAVVAAAGALQTPLLLKRSGLQNRHIGRNLHLHPSILAWGYLPPLAGKDADVDCAFDGGIITACCRELALENSGYGALLQCPCIHPGAFSFIAPWVSATHFKRMMQRYSRTCLVFTLTRDRTCGIVSEEGNGAVVIDYQLSPVDKAMSLRAVQLAVRVLAASSGVAEVGTMSVDADSSDPAHIDDYVARIASRGMHGLNYSIQSAHQMGTCRMGMDSSTSVVDANGECWEVEGLFVGDSSVFPTAIGVNPMVTVQAIAFCTSQNIIAFLKSS